MLLCSIIKTSGVETERLPDDIVENDLTNLNNKIIKIFNGNELDP